MVRTLAVSDEEVAGMRLGAALRIAPALVLAAGDLAFDYLTAIADQLDRPAVMVPGNHDRDLSGYRQHRGLWMRAGRPTEWPGPAGFENADGRIVDAAGLRIAGLGGCLRYRDGPNQWTEAQQARRAKRLVREARRAERRDGRGVDVLLTHAPPRHCGDREDGPHRGFECLHALVDQLRPQVLVHGHIHPYGEQLPDRALGTTRVVNVVGRKVLEI